MKPTPQAKLVLALAMTRLYQEKLGDNAAKLALFYQMLARSLPLEGTGPAVAAAQTLAGYHAFATGRPDQAKALFERASANAEASPTCLVLLPIPIQNRHSSSCRLPCRLWSQTHRPPVTLRCVHVSKALRSVRPSTSLFRTASTPFCSGLRVNTSATLPRTCISTHTGRSKMTFSHTVSRLPRST